MSDVLLAQIGEAYSAHCEGRHADAERMYRNLLTEFPRQVDVLYLLSSLLLDPQPAVATDLAAECVAAASGGGGLGIAQAALHDHYAQCLRATGAAPDVEAAQLQRAHRLDPGNTERLFRLADVERRTGDASAAIATLNHYLSLRPDDLNARTNLGALHYQNGDLTQAQATLTKVIAVRPDHTEALANLGNVLRSQGRLDEAIASFRRALDAAPSSPVTRDNLINALLERGEHAEALSALRTLLPKSSGAVVPDASPPATALIPFGRAGSLFFHALFDGHPEITTLPGLYFKAWFGHGIWNRFMPNPVDPLWRQKLVARVLHEFAPQFDATSTRNVPGNPLSSMHLARDCGFMEMGPARNTPFTVDGGTFSRAMTSLLESRQNVTRQECFLLIHRAFDLAIGRGDLPTRQVFFHIHNPDACELANFLCDFPKARLLYIVRHPVQGLESWMLAALGEARDADGPDAGHAHLLAWLDAIKKLSLMFSALQSPFHVLAEARAVRLEDVKRDPHRIMPRIAAWMGIADHAALYEASFCGLEYWGPFSAATGAIRGFETRAIDLPLGRLFGDRDLVIFETLFWPFAHLHGYTSMDEAGFRARLAEIRPWLDEPLQFEQMLYRRIPKPRPELQELLPYLQLHALLRNHWALLDREGSYRFMVTPLPID